ncbi:TPA_asm: UL43.6 [Human alphaherpesvirus 1]|nr:TPA_asm: UL43.6 [Human alphaherpesvirus 1]
MASEKHLGPQRQARARRSPGMFSHRLDGKRARPQKGDHGHPDVFGPRDPGRCDLIGRRPVGSLGGRGGRGPGNPGSLWVLRGAAGKRLACGDDTDAAVVGASPGKAVPGGGRPRARQHRRGQGGRGGPTDPPVARAASDRQPADDHPQGADEQGPRGEEKERIDVIGEHQERRIGGAQRQALGGRARGRGPRLRAGLPETPQNKGRSTGRQFEPGVYPRGGPREGRGCAHKAQHGAPDGERPRRGIRVRPARHNDRSRKTQRGGLKPDMHEPPRQGPHAREVWPSVVDPSLAVLRGHGPVAVVAEHPAPWP